MKTYGISVFSCLVFSPEITRDDEVWDVLPFAQSPAASEETFQELQPELCSTG